jgi:hypothetical protein
MLETLEALQESAQGQIERVRTALLPIQDVLRSRIAEMARASLEVVAKAAIEFDALSAAQRAEVLAYLGERGWFPSPRLPFWNATLTYLCQTRDAAGVDRYMTKLALGPVIPMIEQAVSVRFQNRGPAITEAIWAHRERHYYLSIPVFLAQADGITCDTINRGMFRADTGRYVRSAVTGLAAPGLTRLAAQMLAPLEAGTSLSATTDTRDLKRAADPTYGPLNRHGVVHGLDLGYGTRVNSCRALVSLGYACWLPDLLRQD